MKVLVVYSSETGNTKNIGEAIYRSIKESAGDAHTVDLYDVRENPDVNQYDTAVIGYWADKGKADPLAWDFMKGTKDMPVGIFSTLGAYPDSDHARKILNFAIDVLEGNGCTVLTEFICQGRVCERLKEKFRNLKPGDPHYKDPEREKRHRDAESHPDDNDRKNAADRYADFITKVEKYFQG